MQTLHLQHKHGGRITKLTAIAHETYQRVASWHFVGDVDWSDGTKSRGLQICPSSLCYDSSNDAGRIEADPLFEKLRQYLNEHGTWHKAKSVGDRLVHWTPKKPAASQPL